MLYTVCARCRLGTKCRITEDRENWSQSRSMWCDQALRRRHKLPLSQNGIYCALAFQMPLMYASNGAIVKYQYSGDSAWRLSCAKDMIILTSILARGYSQWGHLLVLQIMFGQIGRSVSVGKQFAATGWWNEMRLERNMRNMMRCQPHESQSIFWHNLRRMNRFD